MQDIDVEVNKHRVTFDFSRSGLNIDTLGDRAREVLPLLANLVSADSVWWGLTDEDQELRERACKAMNMMCRMAMIAAIDRAELLAAITNGSEKIADHGFPEFHDPRD